VTFVELTNSLELIGEVRKLLSEKVYPADSNSHPDGAMGLERRSDGMWRCGLRCIEGRVIPTWQETPELAISSAMKELREALILRAKEARETEKSSRLRVEALESMAVDLEKFESRKLPI
jgi:hypothetical protein